MCSIDTYNFLFDFNRNYASILFHFRVIAHFPSKFANFNPPHLRLAILVQYRSVTDRQADKQTHDDSICHASIASRGKNARWWTAVVLKNVKWDVSAAV